MNQFADAYVHHIELILMAHGKYTSKHMDEVIKGLQEKRDKLLLEEDKLKSVLVKVMMEDHPNENRT